MDSKIMLISLLLTTCILATGCVSMTEEKHPPGMNGTQEENGSTLDYTGEPLKDLAFYLNDTQTFTVYETTDNGTGKAATDVIRLYLEDYER